MGEEILVAFTIWDPARGRLLQEPDPYRSWGDWWRAQWSEVREARQDQPGQLLALTVPWNDHSVETARSVLMQVVRPAE